MKIELEYPYSNDWARGYIQINPEGRRTVILYNSPTDRSSTQYARYLLAVNEGRYLTESEEADHIDNDFTNDDLSNLQILDVDDHRDKTHKNGIQARYDSFICAGCNTEFTRRHSKVKTYTKYCSSVCSRKMVKPPSKSCETSVDYVKVKEYIDQGLLDTEIAKIMNISIGSVLNYRTQNSIPSKKFANVKRLEDNLEDIKKRLANGEKKVSIYESYGASKNVFARFLKRHKL